MIRYRVREAGREASSACCIVSWFELWEYASLVRYCGPSTMLRLLLPSLHNPRWSIFTKQDSLFISYVQSRYSCHNGVAQQSEEAQASL